METTDILNNCDGFVLVDVTYKSNNKCNNVT